MLSNIRLLPPNLLHRSQQFIQPSRNTYILRRTRSVRLNKLGEIFPKKLKRREYYYELVEDTDQTPKPPLDLVLTSDVSGIGMRGEKVSMNIYRAYRDLLLPKLAVFASSPEAQKISKTVQERKYSSRYSKIVENYLSTKPLKIFLSYENPWTLRPWHVKTALRSIDIIAEEDCITIPKEIKGPNIELENKDFLVYLTMNKSEKFCIRCRIYHWSTEEPMLNHKSIDLNSPSEALFEDETEIIDSLINTEKEIRRSQMLRGMGGGEIASKNKRKRR